VGLIFLGLKQARMKAITALLIFASIALLASGSEDAQVSDENVVAEMEDVSSMNSRSLLDDKVIIPCNPYDKYKTCTGDYFCKDFGKICGVKKGSCKKVNEKKCTSYHTYYYNYKSVRKCTKTIVQSVLKCEKECVRYACAKKVVKARKIIVVKKHH